ncbi:hypothetical protein GH714_030206 [Hevea brasiliensis]|uniref:Phytochrome n=1 Tax=Hevea brasiliensis TaxID=3981 RepID=A0A6A6K7P3_HEVBR|nr:hypothetical protein GH714_030206 [Hevea brasiliensis]
MSSKSTSKANSARSSSARSRQSARVVAQTPIDAKLHVNFEESECQFDYSTSIDFNVSSSTSNVPSQTVSAYLQKMQRGGLIQPFGCMIAVDEQNLKVLAYSENAPEMLDLAPHAVPSIEQQEALTFGTDIRHFSGPSDKPFYAILHRIDVGLVIDLEPVNPADVPFRKVGDLTGCDRVMVYKFHEDEHGEVVAECCKPDLEPYLGLHYPATDIPQASRFFFMKNKVRMICDCLASPVKIIQDKSLAQPLSLCGSTLRSPHGCHAQYMANMGSIASLVMSVTINEDGDEIENDQQKGRKLWGLVVCHHMSPRFVSFPVRDAPVAIITQSPNVMDLVKCDGAALYYGKKFWLVGVTPTEAQVRDIAEWLLDYHSDSTGLITDSLMEAGYPGASVLGDAIHGMAAVRITSKDFLFWFRSHTAKEIKWGGAKHDPVDKDDGRKMHPRSSFKAFLEVVKWKSFPWEDIEMDAIHSLQLILRESLQNEAADVSKTIVNVPSVNDRIQRADELRIFTNEMFRLIETAAVPIMAVDVLGNINGWNSKAVELTGLPVDQAIGMPLVDLVEGDSINVMTNVLSSAMQGVEEKSVEIKLKTFGPQVNSGHVFLVVNACCSRDVRENVVGVCFVGQDLTGQKVVMEKYTHMQGDYVGIVRNPSTLIPPIFMTNENGQCLEWNYAMQKLSGLKREEAVEKMLLGEVFTVNSFGCRVKDNDTLTKLRILLNRVIAGQDAEKMLFGFFDQQGKYVEALLSANKRTDAEGRITGVLFFLHVASPELQYALQLQRMSEQAAASSFNKLEYVHQEVRKTSNGIMLMQNLLGNSDLSKEQRQLLKMSILCREQLNNIINDNNLESIEECYMELNSGEFNLGETLEVVIKQAMTLSLERQVEIIVIYHQNCHPCTYMEIT